MRPKLIAAALGIVVVAAVGACTKAGSSAEKDVTVTACTADPSGGKPVASGEIHNTSSKASSYAIHIKFVDSAGNGVGDGATVVGKVDASGTATWNATGTQSANGPLTCSLKSVTRTVAP
jgi:TRAP-type uncharacterized transport system substrate-binding protein